MTFLKYILYYNNQKIYSPGKICHIDCNKQNYSIILDKDNSPSSEEINSPSILVNTVCYSEKDLGYELNIGDIIKVGRFKMKVRKINLKYKNRNLNKNEKDEKITLIINDNDFNNNNESKVCRICFTNLDFSPLITPCNCTGSSKYIHLSCLQKWLKSKVRLYYKHKIKNNIMAFQLDPVQCEICKEYFPDYVKLNNNLYEICDYNAVDEHNDNNVDNQNYFTLETLTNEKHSKKYIYNVNLISDNSIVYIGRANDSDVKLNDATISRIHSCIHVVEGRLFIRDLNSKYGTSVILQNKQFNLYDEKSVTLQFGRTLLTFVQRGNFIVNFFCCLCKDKKKEEREKYYNENKKGINFEKDYHIKYQND